MGISPRAHRERVEPVLVAWRWVRLALAWYREAMPLNDTKIAPFDALAAETLASA